MGLGLSSKPHDVTHTADRIDVAAVADLVFWIKHSAARFTFPALGFHAGVAKVASLAHGDFKTVATCAMDVAARKLLNFLRYVFNFLRHIFLSDVRRKKTFLTPPI
jgi:hypothetical protein